MQEALAKEGSEETLNEIKTGSNRDLNLRSAVNSVGELERRRRKNREALFFLVADPMETQEVGPSLFLQKFANQSLRVAP